MSYTTLSDLVRRIHAAPALPLPADADLRQRGAACAISAFGAELVGDMPALVNVGALAESMRRRVVVHALRPGVCRLVDDTDLHSLPPEAPALLRGGWIVESRHATRGEPLFGATVCLAGYPLDGAIYLIGSEYPDGVLVTRWTPRWGDGELPEGMRVERSSMVDEHDHTDYAAWAREAARFALVLGLLLESEGAPIKRQDERETPKRGGAARAPAEWATRHLTLGAATARSSKDTAETASTSAAAAVDDAVMAMVNVHGHLKRQRHGPGNALTKWVYVAEYTARRWVAPRPLKIVVGGGPMGRGIA